MKFRRRSKTDEVGGPDSDATSADDPFAGSVRIIRPGSSESQPDPAEGGSPATDQIAVEHTGKVVATPDPAAEQSAAPRSGTPGSVMPGSVMPGSVMPGGDPLLKATPDFEIVDHTADQERRPGHSGVRVIPATPSDDTSTHLDPTAPFDGPDRADGAAPNGQGSSSAAGGSFGGSNGWSGAGSDDGPVTITATRPGQGFGDTDHDGDHGAVGDGDESRPTIVINDDGASAVAAEGSATRPRIDPKFRARRRAVRRSMGRRRMAVLGLGVIVVLVAVVVGALLGSPLFALRLSEVEVTGWTYADQGQMYAVFNELAGTPVLRIDEQAVEAQLEEVPWVEQAVVDTRLPNSATIQIRERIPLATYQGADGRFRILDRTGRVLEIIDGMPVEYMWITVSDPPDLQAGEFGATGIAAAAEVTRSLTPTVRSRVRRISVDQSGTTMALYLRDGTRVNFGAARDIFSKLVRLETLLTDFPGMSNVRIDVSTAETTRSSANMLQLTDGASDPPPDTTAGTNTAGTGDEAGETGTANTGEGATDNPSDDPGNDSGDGSTANETNTANSDPATVPSTTTADGN